MTHAKRGLENWRQKIMVKKFNRFPNWIYDRIYDILDLAL